MRSIVLSMLVWNVACASAPPPDVEQARARAIDSPPTSSVSADPPEYRFESLPPVRYADSESSLGHTVPFQVFPALPGHVRGLLYMAGGEPYGAVIGHGGTADRSTTRVEYKFVVDGSSPFAVYFASEGQGFNYLSPWSVPLPNGGAFPTSAAMFDRTTPNPWGLRRRAHLVDVEVNRGAGGAGIHFVVTNARVVDESPEFPFSVEAVLVAARRDADSILAAPIADGVRMLANDRGGYDHYTFESEPSIVLGIHPSFQSADQSLDLLFRVDASLHGSGPPQVVNDRCPPCPPGAPCTPCRPEPRTVSPSVTLRFAVAARYVIDRSGRVRDRIVMRAVRGVSPQRAAEASDF